MLKIFSNKGEANAIPLNGTNLNFNFAEIINMLYLVGAYFHTSDADFNPNEVWCGTWELEFDGTVLVSKSNTSGSKFKAEAGTVVGEESHTLIIGEMPKHSHLMGLLGGGNQERWGLQYAKNSEWRYYDGADIIASSGESQPHNNIQPSKICFRWHRTA
jgi:hypothetical protein